VKPTLTFQVDAFRRQHNLLCAHETEVKRLVIVIIENFIMHLAGTSESR
jgi:hypothetical protein